ncbi:MAG: hypothetical protein NZ577_00005, partial [Vicinamibacterales bacterium]|nr:hypothetical protein [Vicinamibacterales bacterium]
MSSSAGAAALAARMFTRGTLDVPAAAWPLALDPSGTSVSGGAGSPPLALAGGGRVPTGDLGDVGEYDGVGCVPTSGDLTYSLMFGAGSTDGGDRTQSP